MFGQVAIAMNPMLLNGSYVVHVHNELITKYITAGDHIDMR